MIKDVVQVIADWRTVAALLLTIALLLSLGINDAAAAVTLFVLSYLIVLVIHRLIPSKTKRNQVAKPSEKKGKPRARRK